VVADAGGGDWLLCQVTSNAYGDRRSIELALLDFVSGSLHRESFARPSKLFTAHTSIIERSVGTLTELKFNEVRNAIVAIIRSK
jgi:mRNA interferase MazF